MFEFFIRFRPYFLTFLVLETVVRLSFSLRESANFDGIASFFQALGFGFMMDVMTFIYILPFFAVLSAVIPDRFFRIRAAFCFGMIFYVVFLFATLFLAVAQHLFWDEFESRFNFIAVDYLVYMDEVLGNIWESYPVVWILSTIGVLAVGGGFLYARFFIREPVPVSWRAKVSFLGISLLLAVANFGFVSEKTGEFSKNRYANEIAKSGVFSLFAAFRNNELPYDVFYVKEDETIALARLRRLLEHESDKFLDEGITRRIAPSEKEFHPNVVLITIESLSAAYMETFGNTENLTPNLDRLAKNSLLFTNLYAAGTRTVYGLSAITLSIPPVPGNAIARRPRNDSLFSLGGLLEDKGYDSAFFFGGFGYFDNMNTFFSGNGYRIVDRMSFGKDEISFSNIWGVADADVYARVLKENDAAFARGQKFFDMVLTTSNHRPFTYPEGKIDVPSGTGRRGGVKYTDYALGEFLTEAQKRPWFDETIFVVVADHTAGSSGKLELTPEKHHIPMLFYAPKLIKPQKIETMASQIDLAPTLLGFMNMKYDSRFYGHNLLRSPEPRAFIANYQRLGLLKPSSLTILKPIKEASMYRKKNGLFTPEASVDPALFSEAVAYFQNASRWRRLNRNIRQKETRSQK